jgi:membrane-associated PAP2 superfamily phosphatase
LKNRIIELVGVLTGLLLLTSVCWLTNADVRVSAAVSGVEHTWPLGGQFPWNVLYARASLPAFILTGGSVFVLVAGFFVCRLKMYRSKAVFVLLFLALGPGLVVNVLFKDHLGRARPREIVEFGGSHQHTPIWQPGNSGKNSSFPSGHAAIAFFLIAPWFLLRDEKHTIAVGFLVSGLIFGSLVSIARVVQGGHFIADVFWSAGFMYLIGGVLALFMGFIPKSDVR